MAHDYERHNQEFWDADADDYQAIHGDGLAAAPLAWGVWRIPETELDVLGDVAGRDVLEYGCGAAQWSIALAGRGPRRVVGFDLSAGQLAHARSGVRAAAATAAVGLVQAAGERTPFRDESFDVVFCDHGVMSFCDPARAVAEAARVLRPGGLLAFCHSTQLRFLCDDGERPTEHLHQDYFGMRRFDWSGEGTIDFCVPYGEWIRLFRAHGMEVEDLIELRAPPDATTTYTEYVDAAWARRWPAEQIWKARKG